MSDAVALTAVLASGERDKTPAYMLADELQEREGYGRFRALREAAAVRRAKKDAADQAEAAELVKPTNVFLDELVADALAECGVRQRGRPVTFAIVRGSRWPSATVYRYDPWVQRRAQVVVTVGARWIINAVASYRVTANAVETGELQIPRDETPVSPPQEGATHV